MSSSSQQLPIVNNSKVHNAQNKFGCVLSFFGFINMTISSVITIYRAYNNNDIPMIVFITFVYFGSFFLEYWFRVYHTLPPSDQSPKRRNVKIGIWVLLSTIMLGFAFEFSTFASFTESLCFFGVVIAGNTLVFYVYFIYESDKSSGSACSIKNSCCNVGNKDQKEYTPLTEAKGVDKV